MPFINTLLKYRNPCFIETGTYQGDTIKTVNDSGLFNKIYSLEFSDVFYKNCSRRFADKENITIYKANSKNDLYDIIRVINTPITFWLDAHWSGVADIGVDHTAICPVLYELEQIKLHPIKTHTIMVDDMRLMDGKHFPVLVNDIIQKIHEINSDYKIKRYNDYTGVGDILVAYIEEPPSICIHKYLTKCKTNNQPPGFGDFLRGTIALYKYSKEYNYDVFLDKNIHPLFKYLKNNKYFLDTRIDENVYELIPGSQGLSYEDIDNWLIRLFKSNESFSLITNGFYTNVPTLQNYGEINEGCKEFMKEILMPSDELNINILNAYKEMNLDLAKGYNVIHLRFGDSFLHDDHLNQSTCNLASGIIRNLIQTNPNSQFVLLSDSSKMANELKKENPELFYWDNTKIHLGDLRNDASGILSTMVDFFILSGCNEIFTNGSGFNEIISVIYGKQINKAFHI